MKQGEFNIIGVYILFKEKNNPNKPENKWHPMRKGTEGQKEWLNTDECKEFVLLMRICMRNSVLFSK